MRVGIVGCGVICKHYVENARAFDSFKVVGCADVVREAAEKLSMDFELRVAEVDELISDPGIDVILNLTTPDAHFDVSKRALAAGKHVYSEKPVATTVAEARELIAEADRRGLRLGCAPDIFLGRPYQRARALIDGGAIGEPLSLTAVLLTGGHTTWHPNPAFLYQDGGGPLLDMGPYYLSVMIALLGPVRRVAGFASIRTAVRTIELGPQTGERFVATTPTHTAAVMELVNGVTATFTATFEATDRLVAELVIQGTEGVIALPNPNDFDGPLRMMHGEPGKVGGDWHDVRVEGNGGPREVRGLGLHDLVLSVGEERQPRASGRLACHVVDIARSVLEAARKGKSLEIETSVERPPALV